MQMQQKNKMTGMPVTVSCHHDSMVLQNGRGMTVSQVRQITGQVLSITPRHELVMVNNKAVKEDYILLGGEEVIFLFPYNKKG